MFNELIKIHNEENRHLYLRFLGRSKVPNIAVQCIPSPQLYRWIRPIRRQDWQTQASFFFHLTLSWPPVPSDRVTFNESWITAGSGNPIRQLADWKSADRSLSPKLCGRPGVGEVREFRSSNCSLYRCCLHQLLSGPDRGKRLWVLKLLGFEHLRIWGFENVSIWIFEDGRGIGAGSGGLESAFGGQSRYW